MKNIEYENIIIISNFYARQESKEVERAEWGELSHLMISR